MNNNQVNNLNQVNTNAQMPTFNNQVNMPQQVNQAYSQAYNQTMQQQVNYNNVNNQVNFPKKKKNILAIILFIVCLGLLIYIYISYTNNKKTISNMMYECTPIDKKEEELDINSNFVLDLYSKVYTNMKEDSVILNNFSSDVVKLYFAIRQVPNNKINYNSNCNLFDNLSMQNYTCYDSKFTPKSIKENDVQIEIDKLFGEDISVVNQNVQLGNVCMGGYQYIASRGEFVEGDCSKSYIVQYTATKKLTKAKAYDGYIELYESVEYKNVPKELGLQSGTYIYKFKLDSNYNFIFVDKTRQG